MKRSKNVKKELKRTAKSVSIQTMAIYLMLALSIILIVLNAVFFLYTSERLIYITVWGHMWGVGLILLTSIFVVIYLLPSRIPLWRKALLSFLSVVLTLSLWISFVGYTKRVIHWRIDTILSGIFLSLILNNLLITTLIARKRLNLLVVLAVYLPTILIAVIIVLAAPKNVVIVNTVYQYLLSLFVSGTTSLATSYFNSVIMLSRIKRLFSVPWREKH